MMNVQLVVHQHGTVLPVKAKPNARGNAIAGVQNGMLRISVTAAPEKGKANRAIIALLAKELSIAKSRIEFISGETAGLKRILIRGLEIDELRSRLLVK